MNTSPPTLNPASSTQTQSKTAKPQDSGSDTPFSQVLSSEMAQSRQASQMPADEKAESDTAEMRESDEDESAVAAPATKADTVKIAAAFDLLRAEATPIVASAFLAQANPAGLGQTAASGLTDTASEDLVASLENRKAGPDLSKGQSRKSTQAAQSNNALAALQKTDPTRQSGKLDTSFIGQLTAARGADSTQTGEPLADLMSSALLRGAPPAAMEAPTPTSGAAANRLAPSVGTAAWGQALSEKVVWMAAGTQQTASLTLNPPNLGPLQIVLNISNEQATASFFSAQPEVRQALEAAFPRLREMMSEAGIQLGQATVSADTPQQHASDSRSQRAIPPFPGSDAPGSVGLPTVHSPLLQSGRGLVDTFA